MFRITTYYYYISIRLNRQVYKILKIKVLIQPDYFRIIWFYGFVLLPIFNYLLYIRFAKKFNQIFPDDDAKSLNKIFGKLSMYVVGLVTQPSVTLATPLTV